MKVTILGVLAVTAIYLGGVLMGAGADGWSFALAMVLELAGGWTVGSLVKSP